jgi:hypothetical protein
MGFLDKLKDAGFGNRGPYGRMQSGASYFSGAVEDRLGVETDRGINKAVIAATANGTKMITPEEQFQMAERWGVPVQRVMQLSKPVNDEFEDRETKRKGKLYWELAEGAKKEGIKITPAVNNEILKKAGVDDPEMASKIMASYTKLQPGYTITKRTDDENLESIAGNYLGQKPDASDVTTLKSAAPGTPKEKKLYPLSPDVKLVDSTGKEIARGIKKKISGTDKSPEMQKQIASDIRSLANKLLGIEAGDNIVKEIMETAGHTKAIEDAKNQVMVMIKEYENRFGLAAARAVGFDTTLSGPEGKGTPKGKLTVEMAEEYLSSTNGDRVKAEELAKADGYAW